MFRLTRISVVLTLALVASLVGGCMTLSPTAPGVTEYYGPQSRGFRAPASEVIAAATAAFTELGYEVEPPEPQAGSLIAKSTPTTRFASLIGDRQRVHEVRVSFAALEMNRTRVDVSSAALLGPPGAAPTEKREFEDDLWYDEYFRELRDALLARLAAREFY